MILDTNGISALADGDSNLERMLEDADEIALPVIALGEYIYGIRHSRDRQRYEQWLAKAVAKLRVLVIDQETATEYAGIREDLRRRGRPIPSNDAWIAALARQHNFPVLSRDEHFDVIPRIKRLSW